MSLAGVMIGWLIFVFFVFPQWIGESLARIVRTYRDALNK